MSVLVVVAVLAHLGLSMAGMYTVTDEAWFEVSVTEKTGDGSKKLFTGRFTVALFGEAAPMTVMNFLAITRGYKRPNEPKLQYRYSNIHRIVPDFVIQMGDVTKGDGRGGMSIFGEKFNDEDFLLSHRSAGWVAMANHGKDTNGSQFYILLNRARWLDGKHVVFAKVIQGMDTIRELGEIEADPDTAMPAKRVTITDCGTTLLDRKYEMTEDMLDAEN